MGQVVVEAGPQTAVTEAEVDVAVYMMRVAMGDGGMTGGGSNLGGK